VDIQVEKVRPRTVFFVVETSGIAAELKVWDTSERQFKAWIKRKIWGGAETKSQEPNITNFKQTPTLKLEATNSFLLRFLYFEFVCCLAFAIWGLVNEDNLSPEISLDPKALNYVKKK